MCQPNPERVKENQPPEEPFGMEDVIFILYAAIFVILSGWALLVI